ncbi:bleomycin resistance family protein, partial [candidate division KSB1 bacterium]|nr:bleomycin resistance family protein [candidate division KSB1 bacterium]NIR70461.1 bleomycin resistance family protein [candidate division KSB1 bacterium]NIS23191.1 bleomycin resistance family protein [candidate division KSB1 bacterium]NIT70051.1 bleomycin resistance family protein [candidate division KSB1 bacterium]NIU23688.1 bleomycin resistance family protein [candidate division KSB1 bacterium]
ITEELPELGEQEIGGTLAFFIQVQDIHDLYEQIKNRVNVITEMHTTFYKMHEFAIRDCNGYILTFAEEAS